MEHSFEGYQIVIAPMLYMVRSGVAERLRQFVSAGGILVLTYWTGIVDEYDQCFLDGAPGPLRELAGIWAEEIDALHDGEENRLIPEPGNSLGLSETYVSRIFCELVHAEAATILATYGGDFYAGRPALTINRFGQGAVYYMATRTDEAFLKDFYHRIVDQYGVTRALPVDPPAGVSAAVRGQGEKEWVFLLNFTTQQQVVELGDGRCCELLSDRTVEGSLALDGYEVAVVERNRAR
jgi:beta-galactosidase